MVRGYKKDPWICLLEIFREAEEKEQESRVRNCQCSQSVPTYFLTFRALCVVKGLLVVQRP